jgi:photosystem II stability/assembly factor-like uncharacterized protein
MYDFVLENQSTDVIYALGASPNFATDKVCYAAQQSGLRVSHDGGLTWHSAFDSLDMPTPPPATAVVVASDHTIFVGVPGAILNSTDNGKSWNTTVLPTPAPFITTFAVSPNYLNDGVALAGSMEDGVFVSEDFGKTWNAWNFGLLDQNILCITLSPDFTHDKCVFVGTETGIYTSKNRGRSWRAMNFPTDCSPVLSVAVSPTYPVDGQIWAGTEANGLLCSVEYGASWEPMSAMGSVDNIIVSAQFPAKFDILILLDNQLLISRERGRSWTSLDSSASLSTTVIAPLGLAVGSVLLLASQEGAVSTTHLEQR